MKASDMEKKVHLKIVDYGETIMALITHLKINCYMNPMDCIVIWAKFFWRNITFS